MHEKQPPSIPQLIECLTEDFTPPEYQAVLAEPIGTERGEVPRMSLSQLLDRTRVSETIEERLRSEENSEIGHEVDSLLEGSLITDSFRHFIINEVRHAHAWEVKVSDEVSPQSLGIDVGPGIFNPEEAIEIETQSLRIHLYTMTKTHILISENYSGERTPVILRPAEYADDMMVFNQWLQEFVSSYGRNPFSEQDLEAYLLAASSLRVASEEEQAGMEGLFRNLQELREKDKDSEQDPE